MNCLRFFTPSVIARGGEYKALGLSNYAPPWQSHRLADKLDILILAEVDATGVNYNCTLEDG